MYKTVFCIIILGLAAVPNLNADQWGEGIHQVGEQFFHGNYYNMDRIDDALYISSGYGIEVWDIEDPAESTLQTNLPTRQSYSGIFLRQDDLLFLGTWGHLSIYDISNRFQPELISEIDGHEYVYEGRYPDREYTTLTNFYSIIFIDDVLVSLSNGQQLCSYDLSDPSNPRMISDIDLEPEYAFRYGYLLERDDNVVAYGVPLEGEYDQDSLNFHSYELNDGQLSRVAESGCGAVVGRDNDNFYDPVVIDDMIIYSSDHQIINAINISDLENPQYVGDYDDLRGDHQFQWFYSPDPFVHGERLYVKNPFSIEILDLSNGFVELESLGYFLIYGDHEDDDLLWAPYLADLVIEDDYLTAINSDAALSTWSVANPDDVEELFNSGTGATYYYDAPIADKIAIKDNVVFCAGYGYPTGVGIENPVEPEVVVDHLYFEIGGFGLFSSVLVVEDALYVQAASGNTVLYDISDPLNPDSLRTTDWVGVEYFLQMYDDVGIFFGNMRVDAYQFVPWLYLANLTDPFNPEQIASFDLVERTDTLEYIAVLSDTDLILVAYTPEYAGGWGRGDCVPLEAFFYNIEPMLNPDDPADPEYIGSQDLAELLEDVDFVTDIQVVDELLYMIANDRDDPESGRMFIMDTGMTEVYSETEIVWGGKITIEDTLAYFLNEEDGLFVYDVSDPEQPADLIGWHDTPGVAQQLILVDDLIVVADKWSLQILRLGDGPGDVPPKSTPLPEAFSLSDPYPNPFNSQFSFTLHLPQSNIVLLNLYDISGRKVWSLSERFGVGIHRKTIDLNLNSAGIYFLQANSQFGSEIKRVVMLK